MTQQDYIQQGFAVSAVLAQDAITRAEDDVMEAYIKPILPTASTSQEQVKKALMNLTFILLLKRSGKATRSGAKLKTALQSQILGQEEQISECASTAHMWLEKVRELDGANRKAEVYDICQIYFKSNYFGL